MHGWRFFARYPCYSPTVDDGDFKITGVPPGGYTVVAYHPVLANEQVVDGTATTNFAFAAQ